MKRLLISDVLAAYAKTQMKPKRYTFGSDSSNACPVGAMTRAFAVDTHNGYVGDMVSLGYDARYIEGFIAGFDKMDTEIGANDPTWNQGYLDGQLIGEELL